MKIGLAETGINYQLQLQDIHQRQSRIDSARAEEGTEARKQSMARSLQETNKQADTVARIKEAGYQFDRGGLIDAWA